MKRTLLLLSLVCLTSIAVNAADTITVSGATTNSDSTTRPSFENMGPPPDSSSTSRPTPPNGDFKGGQRPNKKPDSKPGGDRVPPEFSQNSNSSSTNTVTSK